MKRHVRLTILVVASLFVVLACGDLSEAGQHYNAGGEHEKEGRLEQAIAEYDEAIRLDP